MQSVEIRYNTFIGQIISEFTNGKEPDMFF